MIIGPQKSLVSAVNDMVVGYELCDQGILISHRTDQLLPRLNAMRDMIALRHVDRVVLALPHFFQCKDMTC